MILCYAPSPTISNAYEFTNSRDAFVAAGTTDARILIPFLADDATSSSICSLIYSGLTKIDKDLNVAADLAETWKIDNDGLTITFYLRKGVKWHDGAPFTAYDVRFTFETILKNEVGCPYISDYEDIQRIEIPDPYTIRFTYTHAHAAMLLKFGMGIIPKHIFENERNIRASHYAKKPIGTGPYKFSKWKHSEYIILEENPDYFIHIPGIKYYVYRIIPDQTVQFLELVNGEIDSMELVPYQFVYRTDRREFKEKINIYRFLAHSYTYIGYNLKNPLFSDRRVRQALTLAIDKKEIINTVLLGLGEVCTGPFLKGSPYYNTIVSEDAYDPSRAKRLLEEAGWRDSDGNGILDKDGQEFHFRLIINQASSVRENVATIIQSKWGKIGVKAEIQVVAWSAFLSQFVASRNFEAVMLGWTLPVDPDPYAVWHTNSIDASGLNFISYSNKKVDRLIELARSEFDFTKRARLYNEVHRLIAHDAPYTFLFFPHTASAVQKRFKGIDPAPAGIGHNFIDWHVAEDEVKYQL